MTTTCAGTSIGVSETIQSYKPSWQSGACVATAGDLLAKGVVFTMRDMDLSVHDSITGHITIDVQAGHLTAGAFVGKPSTGACEEIEFEFAKQ